VDLGRIDLLVEEGFYANRTDFIRTAIRNQLQTSSGDISQAVARKTLSLGAISYSRADLEALRAAGRTVDIRVLGLATIADDVTPDLAAATIASIEVLGALRSTPAVRAALRDRIV
jgi:Arc/MetJ-type ribon-helix-helix transcriptional regulator